MEFRRSNLSPSASDDSYARLIASLTLSTTGSENDAILPANASASFSRSAAGTMRATSPARSASATSTMRPVRHQSIAFALPMARGRRCVPPMPGMVPIVISG